MGELGRAITDESSKLPMKVQFLSATEAIEHIPDEATVGSDWRRWRTSRSDSLHHHVEKRFLASGHPKKLTCVHALGIGDRKERGLNRFAHEGLVQRVIGGHWVWSPRMQQLAKDNKIQAYVLPGGVIMQLMREVAAKRPGLITHVGLGPLLIQPWVVEK